MSIDQSNRKAMSTKYIRYILFAIVISSCNETIKKEEPSSLSTESRFATLIAQYKDIDLVDTLHVYSTYNITNDTFKYKGSPIDTNISKQFPKKLIFDFSETDYYACYKFSMNANRIGLITRTPSMYAPHSIKLLVFDKQKDSIVDFVELAENWGDAGYILTKTSWLFKDAEQDVKCFIWQVQGHDNSVDNENEKTTILTDTYHFLDFSKTRHDTIKTNLTELSNKFAKFISK